MKIQFLSWLRCLEVILFLLASLAPVQRSGAQKTPLATIPQAPVLNAVIPSGIQPGQSLELLLTGNNLANPTGLSLGVAAKITIPTEDKNGQDPTKLKMRIEVPKDLPLGYYPLRYATSWGVANLRLFCVDDLPSVLASGTNRSRAMAQAVAVPCVVSGALAAEQGDSYRIHAKAGQRLSFDCLSRRLGSLSDVQMSIYDAKTQRELAFDNDSPGCQTDPRISYLFKEEGEYLVEIKEVLNRGGGDYFYRLRIGDFPLATTPVPMAARRGTKVKIAFAGPAVEGVAPVEAEIPADPTVQVVWVAPRGTSGLHGWVVPLAVSDHDEAIEQEPNNEPGKANRMAVPGGITGRFQHSDDTDYYLFSAKKGQKLAIEGHTLEHYSPTLVYLVLKNAKTGAEVAKSMPQNPPPGDQSIEFTSAEDLDYVLEVTHLHFAGGPDESYRITVEPVSASFELTVASDRYDAAAGGTAALAIQVVRKGFSGPIELSVRSPAGLTGTALIKAGQNAVVLQVAARGDLPLGPYPLSVLGKATIDGKEMVRLASARAQVMQALNGLPYPPMHLPVALALAVREKLPFTLAIRMDPPEGIPGTMAKVTVMVQREPGFSEELVLNPPTGLPPTIPAPKAGAIAKDKSEITFPLDLNAKTPLGDYLLFFTVKTKLQGKEFAAAVPPLVVTVGLPFDLQVEPAVLGLKPGEKSKLKITAVRKGGYQGPIALEVRKLPANVTAGKGMIAANQTTTEVEIAATAAAATIEKADVDVAGTASALNNLLNASPAFTVRIEKK